MPIYEYQCSGCGKVIEIITSLDDDQPKICPACGSNAIKIMSAPGISKLSTPAYGVI